MGKCGYYLRASKARKITQPDGTVVLDVFSIDTQRQQCDTVYNAKGWTEPVVEYIDNDTPSNGKTVRHDWDQMFADVQSGATTKLIFANQDRLTRWPRDGEDFLDLITAHGVPVGCYGGEVDLTTDMGRAAFRIFLAMARAEVERKGSRQKAANQRRANNGKAWVMRSFGYDGNKLVKREADAIKRACDDLLAGTTSLGAIAKRWDAAGLVSVSGKPWRGSGVRQTLTRPRIAGLAVYQMRASAKRGKTLKERVNASIIDGAPVTWPAIISRETFDSVLTYLSDPSRHTEKSRGRVYLLSGLAICGACGGTIGTSSRPTKSGGRRPVYACKQPDCGKLSRDQAKTDAKVIDVVAGILARPDAAELFSTKTVDTKAIAAQINKYRESIRAAEREYDEGDIDGRDLKRRRDNLTPKIEELEAKLVGATTSRKLDGLIGNAKARQVFDRLPLDRQRAVVDTVVKVTIAPSVKLGNAFDPRTVVVERQDD